MTLLYEDLTSKILEACFEVSNELGAGFLESVYHKSLIIALRCKGLHPFHPVHPCECTGCLVA